MEKLKTLQSVATSSPFLRDAAVVGAAVVGYQALCYASQTIKGIKAPVTEEEDSTDIRLGDWTPSCVLEYLSEEDSKKDGKEKKLLPIPTKVSAEMDTPVPRKYLYHWKQVKDYVMFGDMKDTSHKFYDFENGWSFDFWGVCHVHITTVMPKVTPAMFMWWFQNMCCGKGKHHWYRWWHPTDHIKAWYDDNQIHPINDKKNGIYGHTKHVLEYVNKEFGEEPEYLRIRFQHPEEFGFDKNDFADETKRVVVCAHEDIMKFQTEALHFVHYIEALPDGSGSILKSRFWIGEGQVCSEVNAPFRWVLNNVMKVPIVKYALMPNNLGKQCMMHCAREMNHLTRLLPELYHAIHEE